MQISRLRYDCYFFGFRFLAAIVGGIIIISVFFCILLNNFAGDERVKSFTAAMSDCFLIEYNFERAQLISSC